MEELINFIKELLEAGSFSPLIMFLENHEEFNSVFTNTYTYIFTFLSGLFTNFYTHTLGFIVDSLFQLFDSSYDSIAEHGFNAINLLFSKFSFQSEKVANNFIYFFIGLLFFSFFVKLSIKLFFWIVDFIKSFF